MKIKVIKSIKFNGTKQVPELNIDKINEFIIHKVATISFWNNDPNLVNSNAIYNGLNNSLRQLSIKLIDGEEPFNLLIEYTTEGINSYKINFNIIIEKLNINWEFVKIPTNVSIAIELTDLDIDIEDTHKVIEGRNILFRYCNSKLISYKYDDYVYESESGFDETKVINNLTQKFQVNDLGDKIEKEYLEALSELNKKLLEKYGVTLECRRTNSLSIVKDGKSIKSIVVKQ